MADAVINNFPTQVVPDAEKISYEYGLKLQKQLKTNGFLTLTKDKQEASQDIQQIKLTFID